MKYDLFSKYIPKFLEKNTHFYIIHEICQLHYIISMHTPKQFKKLHKLSKKVSHQNKTINMLVNLLSGALGYAPGVGPSKSLIEGIRRRDMISNRHINALEAVLKIGAGASGWAGYYYLASPFLHDKEFTTDNMSWYVQLELINVILYTLSGLVAGGEKALHTKQQLINLFNKASHITSRP